MHRIPLCACKCAAGAHVILRYNSVVEVIAVFSLAFRDIQSSVGTAVQFVENIVAIIAERIIHNSNTDGQGCFLLQA